MSDLLEVAETRRMGARELWEVLGRPYVRKHFPGNQPREVAEQEAAAFWAATPPSPDRCSAVPLNAWDETRSDRGPWCRYPMPCGFHRAKPPKEPKPKPIKRTKAEVERENVVLRQRLNLLLAADALAVEAVADV